MTDQLHAAANAFQDADDTWHAALVAKFGNNAGTMRYLVQGAEGELAPLYAARQDAMRAYDAIKQP